MYFQGGDKIPRKGGPGISQSDLLVINKVRLLPFNSLYRKYSALYSLLHGADPLISLDTL